MFFGRGTPFTQDRGGRGGALPLRHLSRRVAGPVLLATALLLASLAAAPPTWAQPSGTTSGSPSRAPATRAQAEMDAKISREVAAESAEAGAAFERGNQRREAGDDDRAADAYAEAARLAPGSSHPLRRLCGSHARRKRMHEAMQACQRAIALADLPMNRAAYASVLLQRGGADDVRDALAQAGRAFESGGDDDFVAGVYCQTALRSNDLVAFERGLARLRQVDPEGLQTRYLATIGAASRGDWSEAEAELAAARAAGLPREEADRIAGLIDTAVPVHARYARSLQAFGAGWGITLLVLIVGGFLLSHAALRSVERLPRERTGRAHGTDALVRRAYKGLLWIACGFYYLSIPLVLAIVVGVGAGIGYFFLAVGHIPIKLVLIVGLFVVYTMWAILKSLFVRPRDEDPGAPVDLDAHPRLREVLHEVARKVGTRPVDRVYITPGTGVAVLERGSALARLRGRPMSRCLVLGIGALQGMRLLQLKAVLAHEYGHFQNEDTAGGGFALAVRRSLLMSAIAMAQSGVATWYNPAWWFVRGFFMLFLRISQGASRLQEVLADRWAAFSYGAAAFEGGLRHVIAASAAFDARSTAVLNEALEEKRGLTNLYRREPGKPVDASEIERTVREALTEPASPYDSHPSPAERFALVNRLVGAPEPQDDGALAMDLFHDPEAIEREMTREVKGRVPRADRRDDPRGSARGRRRRRARERRRRRRRRARGRRRGGVQGRRPQVTARPHRDTGARVARAASRVMMAIRTHRTGDSCARRSPGPPWPCSPPVDNRSARSNRPARSSRTPPMRRSRHGRPTASASTPRSRARPAPLAGAPMWPSMCRPWVTASSSRGESKCWPMAACWSRSGPVACAS